MTGILAAEQLTVDHYLTETDGSIVVVIQTLRLSDGRVFIRWNDGETNVYEAWVNLYVSKD